MASTSSILKAMLPIGQAINIFLYITMLVATGQGLATGTNCVIKAFSVNSSLFYSPVPTLTYGILYLFNIPGEIRIEKRIWILEKAGMDVVWEKRKIIAYCV